MVGAGRSGAECVDYREYLRWVGRWSQPVYGETDVAVSAGYAYVTWESGALSVVSLADPVSPRCLASLRLASRCNAAMVVGDHVFVAADDSGLVIVDVSDPDSPRRIGSVDTPGYAFGVASAGDYTYVADHSAGLQVIDTSDLAAPALVGSAATPDVARAVAVSGAFAYVADSFAGLLIFDISDPTHPRQIGQIDTPGRAYDVAISDGLAYVADLNGGLQIVNVSDPTRPGIVGSATMPGEHAHRLAVRDGVAFVTTTDPAAEGGHLQVVDVSDPAAPRIVGAVALYAPLGIDVEGDYGYVNNYYEGLEVVDLSHLRVPRALGGWRSDGAASAVASFGSRLVLLSATESTTTLAILDSWGPSAPSLIGSVTIPTPGQRALPPADEEKIYTCGYLARVKTLENLAVFMVAGRGLSVVSLADPAAPRLVGHLDIPRAVDMDIVDGHAILAVRDSGLVVVDLAKPSAPRVAGRLDLHADAVGIAVRGDIACVTMRWGQFATVDISDPRAPFVLAQIRIEEFPGHARELAIDGSLALLSDDAGGLMIVDIADPRAPRLLSSASCPRGALRVDGTQVYLATLDVGLVVIDISDPVRPIVMGSQGIPGLAIDVELLGGRAHVVDCTYGLRVLSTHCADAIVESPSARVLRPTPNPTKNWTAVPFRLREDGAVTLDVADVAGRRVRRISSGIFAPGENRIFWDGRDDAGRRAASGIYQVRLTAPDGVSSGRVVRIE